ncbi:hypothetical protein N7478_012679 [Penicillium angulare]|uniref:uncharacterized protein n=1 Tax=Penicillium angulare TaxID=116970 RepID=UPI0025419769|nr:uncharacterized protein N7478_012679 [Penicillium angulare]KAJ5256575.1 hypothetical protein N7478_012679 [Penicillium angulare]
MDDIRVSTEGMGVDAPISRRVGATKSRSGCKTCKIRKVKCGEEKPSCFRCTSTGRKCEFEDDRRSPPTLTPTLLLSSSPDAGRRERRAFEYYFQNVARHLAGGMEIDFWTNVIPQICRSEPAVWDGMIAISTLFEYPNQSLDFPLLRDRRKSNTLNQIQREALTWYSRSISSVHSQIERGIADPYIALISCALFICVETIQGRTEEALQLFRQGVTLIGDLRTHITLGHVSKSRQNLLKDAIIPLFSRLASISLTVSGTQPGPIFTFLENNPTAGFTSLEHARSSITVISADVLLFEREAHSHLREIGAHCYVSIDMLNRRKNLQHRVAEWYIAYTKFHQGNNRQHSTPQIRVQHEPLLIIYYVAISIILSVCLTPLEIVYDDHLAEFGIIVEQAQLSLATSAMTDGSQPPFTFEAGVGVPLFLTALKCRDWRLRRKALELLRQAPQMQGLFKCAPSAFMAEAFMNMEESYSLALRDSTLATSPTSGAEGDHPGDPQILVPEEARIYYYCIFRPGEWYPPGVNEEDVVKFGRSLDQLYLHFSRNEFDLETKTWRQNFECIPFGADLM